MAENRGQVYYCTNKEEIANRRCVRLYGLTIIERKKLFANGCEICGSFKRLAVDHDHGTGKVRGCLCISCNMHLGVIGDSVDPEKYRAIDRYLRKETGMSDKIPNRFYDAIDRAKAEFPEQVAAVVERAAKTRSMIARLITTFCPAEEIAQLSYLLDRAEENEIVKIGGY